jgi:DNA sulfur modification protein DndC
LNDSRPWVIGYSGGKDSTALLQLVWNSLAGLPADQRRKPVYVISSDTLVESPIIVQQIQTTHERIRTVAQQEHLPFSTEIVRPAPHDSFWVNLLGKGYPAPYRRFRWCTDRLKIQPANRFIKATADRFGEVVLALGVRRSESATRAQSMSLHRRHGEALSRRSDLPSAWVFTPIEDWTTNDVWTHLLSVPSPWGNNNRDLVAMYKNANAGECPLVVDTKTPSCGNSRFGCWVCTVVDRDKSMEAMVDNGEYWMEPMLGFRDWLSTTQNPEHKSEIRDLRRRDGRVRWFAPKSGQSKGTKQHEVPDEEKTNVVWGPYKFEFRQEILRRLLRAQKQVQSEQEAKDFPLITMAELEEIRRLWRAELGDWADTLPKIWKEETGLEYAWITDDTPSGSGEDLRLLDAVAEQHSVPPLLLRELIEIERQTMGFHRRSAVYSKIDSALKKDWRPDSAIKQEQLERQKSASSRPGADS